MRNLFLINIKRNPRVTLCLQISINDPNVFIAQEYLPCCYVINLLICCRGQLRYRDKTVNKKHKGLKGDTPGLNFEAYSQRICLLHEFYQNQNPQKIKQKRFQIIKLNMQMVSVNKNQFAGLNDKPFYFNDGIVSLPFGHYLLNKVRKEKEKYKNEMQYQIHTKNDLLKQEATAVRRCERLRILRSIFAQAPLLYLLDSKILMKRPSIYYTKDYILNSNWQ